MTLTYGSILLLKIRNIKKDPDDMSLAIGSAILPGLNADFDGDVLNTMSIPLTELNELFENLSPINMIINRTTGSLRLDVSALENISLAILSDN